MSVVAVKLTCNVVAWTLTSVAMTITNKVALRFLPDPLLLVSAQMMSGAILVGAFFTLDFGAHWRRWLVIPPLIWSMILSSMYGMKYTTIGAFVIVRNTSPMFVALLEWLVFGVRPSAHEAAAMFCIFVGSASYETNDTHFSHLGMCIMAASLLIMGIDRVAEKYMLHQVDSNKAALVFMNNAIGLVAFPVQAWMAPTDHAIRTYFDRYLALEFDAHRDGVLLATCVLGVLLNYQGIVVQKSISATSMAVLSCFSKLMIITFGIVWQGDDSELTHLVSVVLSMAGCVAYTALKHSTQEPTDRSSGAQTQALLSRT